MRHLIAALMVAFGVWVPAHAASPGPGNITVIPWAR